MELSADRPEEARMLLARAAAEVCVRMYACMCMYDGMLLARAAGICTHACTKKETWQNACNCTGVACEVAAV